MTVILRIIGHSIESAVLNIYSDFIQTLDEGSMTILIMLLMLKGLEVCLDLKKKTLS